MNVFELHRTRNRRALEAHHRETQAQILFPVMLALIGALLLLAFVIGATPAARSAWADVSLIFLVILAVLAGLAPLAVFAGLAYGIWSVRRKLPPYFETAQAAAARLAAAVGAVSGWLSGIFISIRSLPAGARRALGRGRSGRSGPRRENARTRAGRTVH